MKNKEKEIEEMSKALDDIYSTDFKGDYESGVMDVAEKLYNAGYRKASEVAREIFEEIRAESSYCVASQNGVEIYHTKLYNISAIKLAELKKKYTNQN